MPGFELNGRERIHLISTATGTLTCNHAIPPGVPQRLASLGMNPDGY
ncbi:MAG: hypothetical protein ACYDEA_04885 [Candidatus Dormibacteria bacterium]